MKTFLVVTAFALTFSFAQATDELTAEEVFSKATRSLPKPPEALTSKTTSLEERIKAESARFERSLASQSGTDIEGKDEAVGGDNSDLYNVDSEGPSRRKRAANRRAQNRAFSVGFVGASSYGIFGVETNLGIGHPWEIGGGLGTGYNYTTWGLHTRHFFFEDTLTPYFEAGYANWRVRKPSSRGEKPNPNYLSDRFFENKSGDIPKAVTRHLIYPGIGVLFQDDSGLALTAILQYLIALNNFSGALYGGFGIHLYF